MAVVNQLNLNVGTEQNPNFVLHDINDKRISTTAVTTATHLLTCNSGVTSIAPITAANLASVLGEAEGIPMTSSTDLNAYTTQGLYKCVNEEYSNAPVAGNISGTLEVLDVIASQFIIQRMTIVYSSSPFIEVYQRRYRRYNQTWSSWYKVTMNVVS